MFYKWIVFIEIFLAHSVYDTILENYEKRDQPLNAGLYIFIGSLGRLSVKGEFMKPPTPTHYL